jgi:hydrogenase-4 component F
MTLLALLAVPLLAAAVTSRTSPASGRVVHGAAAVATLALGLAVAGPGLAGAEPAALGGLLRIDALSAWMVAVIVAVATLAAVEAPAYAGPEAGRFYPLFHLMVFAMLLAVTTDDVGLMWVAIEGTTLASVFLVNFERTRPALEAAYKYLLICSVGIAIAFVGTVLVYFADLVQLQGQVGAEAHALRWTTLLSLAGSLEPRVIELAFVFLLVGYGTKAGLAPMHTWLPDAHSEAPAPVSALMSGVLLSVGVYAVLRFKPIVDLAAGPGFARRLLLGLGLLSLTVAAAFLWSATNYKRMLAYSSVEHIGIVCLGLGFGGSLAVAGALLHVANHGLAKSVLFLLAGRIRAAYGSADIAGVRGLLTAMPLTGRAFLAALLALMGLPPFGLFTSEVMILGGGFREGHTLVSLAALALLVIAFGGLLRAAHAMLHGTAVPAPEPPAAGWAGAAAVAVALALLIVTGVAWPPGLALALDRIAAVVAP